MLEPAANLGPGIFVPLPYPPTLSLPLDTVKVSAGFPSPAADYEESRLDINEYLVRNPVSTFFFPVQGDSMDGAEIHDGDILVVDKSVRARHGHIVIAFIDGQRLVKRLHNRAGRVALSHTDPQPDTALFTIDRLIGRDDRVSGRDHSRESRAARPA
mgnify:CR=1 FL=1